MVKIVKTQDNFFGEKILLVCPEILGGGGSFFFQVRFFQFYGCGEWGGASGVCAFFFFQVHFFFQLPSGHY